MNKKGQILIGADNQRLSKGQVWIETVIYTLIAFSLIATVLAFAKPKIDEAQDKAVIEQSISMMKEVDSTIRAIIQGGAGNKRILEISIKKGSLDINGENDLILFGMDSRAVYSEIGKPISEGNLIILTEKKGSSNFVTIKRDYSSENVSITYDSKDELKSLTKAGTSYKISFTNKGKNLETGEWDINIGLV